MMFSETFAVVTDYKTRGSKIYARTHAVLLADGHEDSPIRVKTYEITKPEIIPYKDIKSFLKKYIPKNYDVYLCDGYYDTYSKILEELRYRFTVKNIDDTPEELQERIIQYFMKVNSKVDVNVKKSIDAVFEKECITI
jgi:hypothetical protein